MALLNLIGRAWGGTGDDAEDAVLPPLRRTLHDAGLAAVSLVFAAAVSNDDAAVTAWGGTGDDAEIAHVFIIEMAMMSLHRSMWSWLKRSKQSIEMK